MKRILLAGVVLLLMTGCGKKTEYNLSSLLRLLKDKDPKMRYYAAKELGHFGAEAGEVVPALAEALKDEDKNVRTRAANSLAEIGGDARAAIPALREALKDPEQIVRKAAASALSRLQDPRGQAKQGDKPARKPKRRSD
jgi:vesicle coat complex subunit